MKFLSSLFISMTMVSFGCLAQLPLVQHQSLTHQTGKWSVVMTIQPDPVVPGQTVKGLTAERTMVGDYCLHEVMRPDAGASMPAFTRIADLAWNVDEQRWDYLSIDTRITAGIMFFTFEATKKDSIVSFITSFPNPGFGPEKKGRGQALHARNVVIRIDNDHDLVRQYWRVVDQPEWLAVQYDYRRIR